MLEALLLGIIEGLTEFLPISSTGHLLIAEHWLGRRSDFFNVAIQSGAIAAVTLVYRGRLVDLIKRRREPDACDYLKHLAVAFFVTAGLGLGAKLGGVSLPETVAPVAWAMIIGGGVVLLVERRLQHIAPSTDTTWRVAVAVGIAQVIAGVFPGTSRSAAAIFAAMLVGLTSRQSAAEFAFLVGIPTMLAATGYELIRLWGGDSAATPGDWAEFGIAFVAATATGFAAVKWLLRFVAHRSFSVFGWYRIALASALLVWLG